VDISFVLKIAGIGMVVAIICQVLNKIGREEQTAMVSIAGLIVVLVLLIGELGDLFDLVKDVFGL
jgi:stage III sporulation protein AC